VAAFDVDLTTLEHLLDDIVGLDAEILLGKRGSLVVESGIFLAAAC